MSKVVGTLPCAVVFSFIKPRHTECTWADRKLVLTQGQKAFPSSDGTPVFKPNGVKHEATVVCKVFQRTARERLTLPARGRGSLKTHTQLRLRH